MEHANNFQKYQKNQSLSKNFQDSCFQNIDNQSISSGNYAVTYYQTVEDSWAHGLRTLAGEELQKILKKFKFYSNTIAKFRDNKKSVSLPLEAMQ